MVRAENRKFHVIYKTTNLINGKFYVGMHSTDDLNDGYLGSGKRILYSLTKWGKENHSYEVLEFLQSRKALIEREKEIINEQFLNNPLCLNIRLGGDGGFDHCVNYPKEQITEWKRMGARAVNGARSKKHHDRMKTDPEYRDATRKAVSEAAKARVAKDDYVNPNLGNTYSDEVRKKMSELNMGERNSQFGTCWVYNVDLRCSIKIPKDELNSRLDSGWIKGRKIFKEEQHVKET